MVKEGGRYLRERIRSTDINNKKKKRVTRIKGDSRSFYYGFPHSELKKSILKSHKVNRDYVRA